MNYSELLDNVRNYTEVTSDVLSNSVINVFLTNTENKVARQLDSDDQRRYATTTFVSVVQKVDLDLLEHYKL
jgi:hypothetical protein